MKKAKAAKTRAGGLWTRSRYFSFIRSALRRAFTRYPVQYNLRKKKRKPYDGPNKLQKWTYQCEVCQKWFMQKETVIDHRLPCGTLKRYEDLAGFTERLFCEEEGLQIVCKACHKAKTKAERESGAFNRG